MRPHPSTKNKAQGIKLKPEPALGRAKVQTNLENDDSEHDEEADADDDGEREQVRVDVERLVVGDDQPDRRVGLEGVAPGDELGVAGADEDARDETGVVAAHRDDLVRVDVVDDGR